MADMNKENPTAWSSPTESVRRRWEKPGSYFKKKGLFENLHGTSAAKTEGFRHELSRRYTYQ